MDIKKVYETVKPWLVWVGVVVFIGLLFPLFNYLFSVFEGKWTKEIDFLFLLLFVEFLCGAAISISHIKKLKRALPVTSVCFSLWVFCFTAFAKISDYFHFTEEDLGKIFFLAIVPVVGMGLILFARETDTKPKKIIFLVVGLFLMILPVGLMFVF